MHNDETQGTNDQQPTADDAGLPHGTLFEAQERQREEQLLTEAPAVPKKKPAYSLTERGLTIYLNGKMMVAGASHVNFDRMKQALREQRFDDIGALMDIHYAVNQWSGTVEGFEAKDGVVSYQGEAVDPILSAKIIRMIDGGYDAGPLLAFARKLLENPSNRAQKELMRFCDANNFLIDEDGDIIAYKGVKEDYTDCHTGTVLNTVGAEPSMPRSKVDDNPNNACSNGYHVGAFHYAKGYAGDNGHLMVCKINPRDVVAIPVDANGHKMRCCLYKVVGEVDRDGNEVVPMPVKEVIEEADIPNTNPDAPLHNGAYSADDSDDEPSEFDPADDDDSDDDDSDEDDEDDEDALKDFIPLDLRAALTSYLMGQISARIVTNEEDFAAEIAAQGYDITDRDVRRALCQMGFSKWLQ